MTSPPLTPANMQSQLQRINDSADFWRHDIGVNVIPSDTKNKTTDTKWSKYQDSPIPEWQHQRWKYTGAFNNGIAIILGKVWHHKQKEGLYLNVIDADNLKAIEEICTLNGKKVSIQDLAQWTLVEQHLDDTTKAHVLVYSHKPFTKKSSDIVVDDDLGDKIKSNEIPAIEVKGLGSHGILFVSSSVHKNGHPYEIIGTKEPVIADDLEHHIDNICRRYSITYLNIDNGKWKARIPIGGLFKEDFSVLEGHNRHEALLRAIESLITRNSGILSPDKIKQLAREWNNQHCIPPLDDSEFAKQWNCATSFIAKKQIDDENKNDLSRDSTSSNNSSVFVITPERLTVSEALRRQKGYVKVEGQIVGQSSVYNTISAIILDCNNSSCRYHTAIDYRKKPVLRSPISDVDRCPTCKESLALRAEYEYTSTIDIELQNPNKFSEIERISVRLFEKDTENIVVGEIVEVTGDLHVIRKNDNKMNKPVTTLYARSIEYPRKDKTELKEKDIEEIESWTRSLKNEGKSPLDELVKMFAPTVIGNEHVKEALLMVAANAGIPNNKKRIPRRLRLNALLIGDPSLAKSTLLYEIAGVVPNARYESAQSSTGLSLTAQVNREEGGLFNLRLGPIPMANGSLCALNEIGQMPISDHKHFLDFMEEGESTINKYGINARIVGNTSIVASANPINNQWIDPDRIDNKEFPTLTQIIQRFDAICVFRETTDPETLRKFAKEIDETAKNSQSGVYDGYGEFVKKYLMYARRFCPTISEDAQIMLNEYWVKMAEAGVRGLPRKLESLKRMAIARTKLKLIDIADIEEAEEMMKFYNVQLQNYNQAIPISKNPRDIAYNECVGILHNSKSAMSFEEVVRSACQRNEQVRVYIGNKFKLEDNKRLRPLLDMFLNHDSIKAVQHKPWVLQWINEDNSNSCKSSGYENKCFSDNNDILSDPSDPSDPFPSPPTSPFPFPSSASESESGGSSSVGGVSFPHTSGPASGHSGGGGPGTGVDPSVGGTGVSSSDGGQTSFPSAFGGHGGDNEGGDGAIVLYLFSKKSLQSGLSHQSPIPGR